ncbi:unnamed protein product, partial [Symbiodinium sp. CCMP2592]
EGAYPRFLSDYREERDGAGESVYLHLYDLNDTFAHMNSVSLDLFGIGGVVHVGVEVLGNEWSFGMQGVSITTPKQNQYYTFRQTVTMGRSGLRRKEVEGVILALKRRWSGVDYDLLERNCGHFCNELCQALGVGRMPNWVTRVAEAMASMPGSHTLKNSISRAIMEDGTPRRMDEDEAQEVRSLCQFRQGELRSHAFPSYRCQIILGSLLGDVGCHWPMLPAPRAFTPPSVSARRTSSTARAANEGEETGVQGHLSVNPVHDGVMAYTERYWEESAGPFNFGVCTGAEVAGCGTPDAYSGPYLEVEIGNTRWGIGAYGAVAHDDDS